MQTLRIETNGNEGEKVGSESQRSDDIKVELGRRCIFEHYRMVEADYGYDSGTWEERHGESDFLPIEGEVNVDREAVLKHINEKRLRVRDHYDGNGAYGYLGNCRMSNAELFLAMRPDLDKDKYKIKFNKLNGEGKSKYCLKFGCTKMIYRRRLCKKHYTMKMNNPMISMTRHAYCNHFSFLSHLGMSLEQENALIFGEDSDYCEEDEENVGNCSDEEGDISDDTESLEEEKEEKEENVEKNVEIEWEGEVIDNKCIAYSCNTDIYCKKIGLCKTHYSI